MSVIDHGTWSRYVPENPYFGGDGSRLLYCKRDADSMDWYVYLYGNDPQRLNPEATFEVDTVKMTVDIDNIVQAVSREAALVFPQSCRMLEVTDDVADPFAKYNGKLWTGTDFISYVAVPESISDRQFFQQLAKDGKITTVEALAAVKTGAIPATLWTFVDQIQDSGQKFDVEMLLSGAVTFRRGLPLTALIATYFNYTPEEADTFFRAASQL